MGGKASRDKGCRGEREIVAAHLAMGFDAKRVPLSGLAEGFPGDITNLPYSSLPGEVKWREDLPKRLWEWLEGRGVLFLKRNRYPWLVVMPLDEFLRVVKRG